MSQSPHISEFRAMVFQEYLDGLGSYETLATKYQIGSNTFREWAVKYKLHGLLVFQGKKGNAFYSSDFKTRCVEAVLIRNGESYQLKDYLRTSEGMQTIEDAIDKLKMKNMI